MSHKPGRQTGPDGMTDAKKSGCDNRLRQFTSRSPRQPADTAFANLWLHVVHQNQRSN